MMTDGRSPIVVTVDHPPIGHAAALWSACLAERLSQAPSTRTWPRHEKSFRRHRGRLR